MTIRKLLVAAASIAAISPAISQASPENSALKACAQAFAASLASGTSAPAFTLKYHNDAAGPLAEYYSNSRDYTFYLRASDPKTGLTLARATCSADLHGTVSSLTATETSPALAAKL